ncbi:MAG TPA: NAD(P)H-binding protein [Ramlibacter sp.]|nr:NAD(P)H-binding protein [Ramlibacter sp.]
MFVLLGSNGQIASQLAGLLLAAGHPVRVVGRNASALARLAHAGAQVAVGDPGDSVFLERAFSDATGVYTMIPPCYADDDMRTAQDRIGTSIVRALDKVRVSRVVNLSSIGAELPKGTGPIEALHAQEQRLNAIDGIDLLHLRPGWFMENLLPAAAVIAAEGVLAGMESPDATVPMAATRDIAAVAVRELTQPKHRGELIVHAHRHMTMREVAVVLGTLIGKPSLQYVQAASVQAKAELRAQGFSTSAADQLEALARWLSTSPLASFNAAPVELQPTTIEMFAREVFAPAYAQAALKKA